MSYEEDPEFPPPRSDDSPLDPRQLLKDIDALVAAGLVVPVRDRSGEVRVTPTAPLDIEETLRAS
ncbi:hypothetical protein VSS74_10140 [Conexibacter stalactiti]|uniref:DUF3253 domain-containing protein n=1 Tax=Conexibacter stalactiti TaxID=1940611 RepID=A0ABU4HPS3_9ACTN|nr:hypothetical protein [Conexibacter stalactiti]MDW5594697.1 hypothetical protein [Conexibacter stalactiti]MEC5035339.1 hypothetical protein [Conexibacter stalactiti]